MKLATDWKKVEVFEPFILNTNVIVNFPNDTNDVC